MNNLNGNWHTGHLGEGDFREEVVFDSNSGLVCNVIDKGECGQSKANLIAAAPELLKQCERQLDWLEHIKDEVKCSDSIKIGFNQSIKYLNQVISKAKWDL